MKILEKNPYGDCNEPTLGKKNQDKLNQYRPNLDKTNSDEPNIVKPKPNEEVSACIKISSYMNTMSS